MTSFLIANPQGILTGRRAKTRAPAATSACASGVIAEIGASRPQPGERSSTPAAASSRPGWSTPITTCSRACIKAAPQGIDEALAKWLRVVPYRYWDSIDEEALRVSAAIGLAELVLSGATTRVPIITTLFRPLSISIRPQSPVRRGRPVRRAVRALPRRRHTKGARLRRRRHDAAARETVTQ